MSVYGNWEKVVESFESSNDFVNVKSDKHYNSIFIEWLKSNHLPPKRKESVIKVEDLTINITSRSMVKDSGERIICPKKIFDLIVFFVANPGRVLTRAEILDSVWGDRKIVLEKTVDVHINYIRRKLGNDFIVTYKGIGYGLKNLKKTE